MNEKLSITVILYLLFSITNSFSCHRCQTVSVQELSTKEAQHYRSYVDRCVDFDGTAACMENLRKGFCYQSEIAMKAKCNDTCDLCRFRESGDLQPYDEKYWISQTDFSENFETVNVSLVAVETSSYSPERETDNIIDANFTSYFETEYVSEPYIVVNLGSTYFVFNVYVINRWGEGIIRRNLLSLDNAQVSTILIPPIDSSTTGNSTLCGEIRGINPGFSLDEQTYKIVCSLRPISTHVKLFRVDYNKLEISEIQVSAIASNDQCGKDVVSECDPLLGNDQCFKLELSGIWHGKRIVYTRRGCYYPSLRNDTNCPNLMSRLNKRWAHMKSHYKIEGAYDPNSFALTECDQYLCDNERCNRADKPLAMESYLIVILTLVFHCFLMPDRV